MEFLGFYDAAAPVIAFDSIDMSVAYRKGRYGQAADYLNLPFRATSTSASTQALSRGAVSHTSHDWENLEFFEGCMPIEEIARRGIDTPRFGPLKPVGLEHPATGERFYAVAQLRQEDAARSDVVVGGVPDRSQVGRPEDGRADDPRPGRRRGGALRRDAPQHLPGAPRLLDALAGAARPSATSSSPGCSRAPRGTSSRRPPVGWRARTPRGARSGFPPVVPPEASMLGGLVRYLATAKPTGSSR
jgi:methylenetetrahydrofolate--tRNA-(uracil-5-)-methyltransferase